MASTRASWINTYCSYRRVTKRQFDQKDFESTAVSVRVSVRLPPSEPGSSSVSGHVLGNQERSPYPDHGSAAACCLSLCRFRSFPHRHCDTSHVKYIYWVHGKSDIWYLIWYIPPWPTRAHTRTHTCSLPAMNQYRSHLLRPRLGGCSDEGQDRQSVFWDAHVWPLGVVVMEDCVFNFPLRSLEDKKGCYYVCDFACVDTICVCKVPYLWCLWRWTSAVCSKRRSCCFSGSPGTDRIPPGSLPASTGHILSVERWYRKNKSRWLTEMCGRTTNTFLSLYEIFILFSACQNWQETVWRLKWAWYKSLSQHWKFKAALINIFILTMAQMIICKVKGGSLIMRNPQRIVPQLCSSPQLYGAF